MRILLYKSKALSSSLVIGAHLAPALELFRRTLLLLIYLACISLMFNFVLALMHITFLGLHRVHFSFSTCWLSLSHHMTNHPSISITWPITWLVTWPPTWPVTCHPVTCSSNITCPMSPAPRSPTHHLILSYLIPHDSSYPWLVFVHLP